MSSKKTVSSRYLHTPATGVKENTKNKQPTFKSPLYPISSKTSFNQQADISVAEPLETTKLVVAELDWELKCDLVYSDYLQAVMVEQIVDETIHNYEEAIDDQLSQQTQTLRKVTCRDSELVCEIKKVELQMLSEKSYLEFEEAINSLNKFFKISNVDEKLTTLVTYYENACNEVYLKNIKPLEKQEDYDKFTTLVEKCTDSMKKLVSTIGNTKIVENLSGEMRKYIEAGNQFRKKQKVVSELLSQVNYLTFKSASDKFASTRRHT